MNIDSNEQSIKLFDIFRPTDSNIIVGLLIRGELQYHIFKRREAENSFVGKRENLAVNIKRIKVYNINEILEEYRIENIDFVDIDVERFDEKIVQTFNWKSMDQNVF